MNRYRHRGDIQLFDNRTGWQTIYTRVFHGINQVSQSNFRFLRTMKRVSVHQV